jgi:hypothetical protein
MVIALDSSLGKAAVQWRSRQSHAVQKMLVRSLETFVKQYSDAASLRALYL